MNRPHRLLFVPLLLLPACADLGDRAAMGECPDGQVCSPLTPEGLEFTGSTFAGGGLFGDPGLKVTAVGGTQTVSAYDHETGSALSVPFDASITGEALDVTGTSGNQVDLEAPGDGFGKLQLVDREDRLLDSITMETTPIGSIRVGSGSLGERTNSLDIALWSGAQDIPLAVVLTSENGLQRLADESMVITTATGDIDVYGWDALVVTNVTTDLDLEITAGDRAPLAMSIPAATVLETAYATLLSGNVVHAVGSSESVCLHATGRGGEVLGVPWVVTVDGPATLSETQFWYRNCFDVTLDAAGTVTVTATAPGELTTSVELNVTAPSQKPTRVITRTDLPPTLGDRAR
jgi:hypothetical protein